MKIVNYDYFIKHWENIILKLLCFIKYFIDKKCSYYPKVRVNSLKTSTIYARFWCFIEMRMLWIKMINYNNENYEIIEK